MSIFASGLALSSTFRLAAVFACLALVGTACANDIAGPFLEPGSTQVNGADRADSQRDAEVRAERRAEDRAERRAEDRAERRAEDRADRRAERRAEIQTERRAERRRAEAQDERRAERRAEIRAERRAEARAERRAEARAERRAERRARGMVLVSRVVDGDTIEVQLDGTTDIRLIGVDTPETVHPTEPVGCFGPAASNFTKHKLEGHRVRLEYDVERTDLYGRTLAYVFADGLLFNETLVARGYAQVTTYPPNVKYENRFLDAQRSARGADRGFWGQCSPGQGGGEGGASPGGGRRSGDRGNHGCDPNYSGACIRSYPPDIDCANAGSEGFRSTGSDPHGFDSDGDGLACE